MDGIEHHRHGGDRRVAELLQLRQLRGNPGLDRRPGHQAAAPAAWASTSSSSAAPTSSTAAFRGYFDNDAMESANVPDELAAHRRDARDGGSQQADLRLRLRLRRPDPRATRRGSTARIRSRTCGSSAAPARWSIATQLKNPNVKLNWQATKKDMVSFLYFDGFKIKDGRSPGVAGILFDAPTATFHQDNAYTDIPLHGLWKIADDRVFAPNLFLSAKYALLQHRLRPRSRWAASTQQAGRNFMTAQSFGSVNQSLNVRPQQVVNVDVNSFLTAMGGSARPQVRLRLSAPSTRSAARCGPATASWRIERRRPTCRRRCSARATAATAPTTSTSTSATRSRTNRVTVDLGLRYDRQ